VRGGGGGRYFSIPGTSKLGVEFFAGIGGNAVRFDVIVHGRLVVENGKIVSSTVILKLIAEGDVTRAARIAGGRDVLR